MTSSKTFQEKSYKQHSEHFKRYTRDGDNAAKAKTWFEKDTVDAWRHQRMYQALDPILAEEPQAKWLTVGDGRYGKDARYIIDKGCDALASDISEHLLREAKNIGYIAEYKVENAESMSFGDSEFDYVFCKDSYHHFPRPMVALYEMLRVARCGVLLIEPNDNHVTNTCPEIVFRNMKEVVKFFLGIKTVKHFFEESGNYVFTLSRRELEKVALGLNYKTIAFKGINDAYLPGVEYEKISEKGPLQKKIRLLINVADFQCKLGVMDYSLLASILFKREPPQKLLKKLLETGYEVIHLPENPHISG